MANSRKWPGRSDLPETAVLAVAFAQALDDLSAQAQPSDSPVSLPSLAVAFSGGLDSCALLHLASAHALRRGQSLHAFHIHHGLSSNADAWLAHSQQVAQALDVPFVARRVRLDLAGGRGLEDTARIARYQTLGELCRAHGVGLLLCAHHQDDQAETVLLQLLRGSGLPGLAGMAAYQPRHPLLGPGVALGRPLLRIGRQRLEQFCQQQKLSWIEDESNTDPRFRRNVLRHAVMPVLDQHFPGFAPLLARSAAHAHSAQELLEDLAVIDLQACQEESGGLRVTRLQALAPARCDNLLRHWLARQGAPIPSTAQLAQIRVQMLQAQADRHPCITLGTQQLQRCAGVLRLCSIPRPTAPRPVPVPAQETLTWAGEARLDVLLWKGALSFLPASGLGLSRARLLQQSLQVRPRTGGERLQLALNPPSRSLKNLYQEAGIPAQARSSLPLIYLGDELVFAAGLGMDVRLCCSEADAVALHWVSKDAPS